MKKTDARLIAGLGRPERKLDLRTPELVLTGQRILVTGAAGAIGQPLVAQLRDWGMRVIPTDIDTTAPWGCQYMDVTRFRSVLEMINFHTPDLVINLAAAKLAPAGEVDPGRAVEVNLVGTMNLIKMGVPILLASTCKAIAPETCYGASKLVAERMVLNAGGTVARFVNVPECGPSMLTQWDELPEDAPIPVTPCTRYIITEKEAVGLVLWAACFEAGRYKIDAGDPVSMADYATRVFPGREQVAMEPRRGDRIAEPHHSEHEEVFETVVPYIEKVTSYHDE